MAHVDARLAYRVRLLDYLDHRTVDEALDVLEFGKVVQRHAVQLQRKAGPMARVLSIHQQVMYLLHQFHRTDLQVSRARTGGRSSGDTWAEVVRACLSYLYLEGLDAWRHDAHREPSVVDEDEFLVTRCLGA